MNDEAKEPRERKDAAPRRRGVAGGERRKAERKRLAKETLLEIANLADAVRGRGEGEPVEDLVEIIRRDAESMADVIASVAGRWKPAGWFVDHVFGQGGPLSMLTAFGPFLRRLFAQAREVRAQQLAAFEAEQAENPVFPFDHVESGV